MPPAMLPAVSFAHSLNLYLVAAASPLITRGDASEPEPAGTVTSVTPSPALQPAGGAFLALRASVQSGGV